jgi:hypothetical protein
MTLAMANRQTTREMQATNSLSAQVITFRKGSVHFLPILPFIFSLFCRLYFKKFRISFASFKDSSTRLLNLSRLNQG